jgi:hypothetical protein
MPDARDRELAAALAVTPLDEVTRRRLVAGALAATTDVPGAGAPSAPSRRSWIPLVAAAVVILAVVVGVFALAGGGNDTSDTATRKDATTRTDQRAAAEAPESAAGSVAVGVADYGDLGNLSRAAARRRAREELAKAPDAAAAGSAASPNTEQLLQAVAHAPCAEGVRSAGDLVGVASATFHGHDAVVVVVLTPSGARTGYLLVPDPCSAITL